ncbi:transcription initiation factor TFIID subunit 4-like [Tympanuchus pallidicinctus]|uniref:transcription initiation factor TFIID subunit 4-like n=1 Tax=Tympanuchus pallidicinctus TaxID=109042 RepID=UPI0022876B28|nr:transcription initiation factor TFIID subunit 4-like [Tympanuchus pallidicinctus]
MLDPGAPGAVSVRDWIRCFGCSRRLDPVLPPPVSQLPFPFCPLPLLPVLLSRLLVSPVLSSWRPRCRFGAPSVRSRAPGVPVTRFGAPGALFFGSRRPVRCSRRSGAGDGGAAHKGGAAPGLRAPPGTGRGGAGAALCPGAALRGPTALLPQPPLRPEPPAVPAPGRGAVPAGAAGGGDAAAGAAAGGDDATAPQRPGVRCRVLHGPRAAAEDSGSAGDPTAAAVMVTPRVTQQGQEPGACGPVCPTAALGLRCCQRCHSTTRSPLESAPENPFEVTPKPCCPLESLCENPFGVISKCPQTTCTTPHSDHFYSLSKDGER